MEPTERTWRIPLGQQRGRGILPGTAAEWGGLFVFGVGVYGATYRPLTRHLYLWGVVPLDWFFLALLLIGAGFMLGASHLAEHEDGPPSGWARFFSGLRLGVSLALLAGLVWWAIVR